VTPFLILDGHGSHFELPFLYNVSSAEDKWTLASWWLSSLEDLCSLALVRFNIIKVCGWIVHCAWQHSFAKKESSKKAISEKG
jgi:hypothetical protein